MSHGEKKICSPLLFNQVVLSYFFLQLKLLWIQTLVFLLNIKHLLQQKFLFSFAEAIKNKGGKAQQTVDAVQVLKTCLFRVQQKSDSLSDIA